MPLQGNKSFLAPVHIYKVILIELRFLKKVVELVKRDKYVETLPSFPKVPLSMNG